MSTTDNLKAGLDAALGAIGEPENAARQAISGAVGTAVDTAVAPALAAAASAQAAADGAASAASGAAGTASAAQDAVDLVEADVLVLEAAVVDLQAQIDDAAAGSAIYDKGDVSGAVVVNYLNGPLQKMRLVGNITSLTFTNLPAVNTVARLDLFLVQDATGSRTLTAPNNLKKAGGGSITLSTTAGLLDHLRLVSFDQGRNIYVDLSLGHAVTPEDLTNGETFTAAGTYERAVPAGVTSVTISATAGGGGGGGGVGSDSFNGGGGGGGQAIVGGVYAVTPGDTIRIIVGAGGVGGVVSGVGGTGGVTNLLKNGVSFRSLAGGLGGQVRVDPSGGNGGASGGGTAGGSGGFNFGTAGTNSPAGASSSGGLLYSGGGGGEGGGNGGPGGAGGSCNGNASAAVVGSRGMGGRSALGNLAGAGDGGNGGVENGVGGAGGAGRVVITF